MVDFGPASKGIGLGIGIIGMGIGLKFLDNTVKNMEKPRKYKSKPKLPAFGGRNDLYRQHSIKHTKWKL